MLHAIIKRYSDGWPTLIMFMLLLQCISCRKFVTIDPPQTQLLGSRVFEEEGTATAVLTDLYARMRSEGMLSGTYNNFPSLAADEWRDYSTSITDGSGAYYNNSIIPSHSEVALFWNTAYNQIYTANNILEGVARSASLSQAFRQQLRGEALFIRAFLHFYLVTQFGRIPYIDTTTYFINRSVTRLPADQVYERILTDLREAESLLPDNYITAYRARVNKWVAKAMLARVYLYRQDWPKAEAMATAVIDHTQLYKPVDDLDKIFLKESTETIWHFDPGLAGINTKEGEAAILYFAPVNNGKALSEHFMAAFEPGDQRRIHWVGEYKSGNEVYPFPFKYKQRAKTDISLEYSVVLRLSEQFLIRAEARAQQKMYTMAAGDLNRIRHRAGLGDTDAATTEQFMDAILHERQIELFNEFGHRWFDLVRTGRADQVLKTRKPGWNATDTLLPIPQNEILSNPNLLPQNPGFY